MQLKELHVRPIDHSEDAYFQELMQKHHYLGALPKIGETIRYVAIWQNNWVALLSFSAAAWKCKVRDHWLGWNERNQYDRLNLITNNSRFLILPNWHISNLGSRVLSLCKNRLVQDWQQFFGHPVFLLETFVDSNNFNGTLYKAANWFYLGKTKGYKRTSHGYSSKPNSTKLVFVQPLQSNAQTLLSQAQTSYDTGSKKSMLSDEHIKSLPSFFKNIPDPRRRHGRRHRLHTVLAIVAGAILCGMRGYQEIYDWAKSLGKKARRQFDCRIENNRYVVPSLYVMRNLLIRIDPDHLEQALQCWNLTYGQQDQSLAIDGKTMCNAFDEYGRQTHIISVVGHESKDCYAQKKVGDLPDGEELKRTDEIQMTIPLLNSLDIQGKDITADALLTQSDIARYLFDQRGAQYHFTVKGNQGKLYQDISLYFKDRQDPDYIEPTTVEHGRITTRKIWTTTALNDYLEFPYVGQAYAIEREFIDKKTGEYSSVLTYEITSRPPEQRNAKQLLAINRGHWSIESCHHIIDWNFDEDRRCIRTGNGPTNITRFRRFVIGLIKSKSAKNVSQKMRELNRNVRTIFDYFKMTKSSNTCKAF